MKYKRRKKEKNPNYNDEVEDKSEDMILVTKNVTIEGFYHVFLEVMMFIFVKSLIMDNLHITTLYTKTLHSTLLYVNTLHQS